MTTSTSTLTRERADLLETLRAHRFFLRYTVQGLTEEQARQRTTASELTLGGLLKHVAHTESGWADFIENGPGAMAGPEDPEQMARWQAEWHMTEGETLADVLAHYDEVAARTDALVAEPARPRRRPPAAPGAVVRAGRAPLRPPGVPAHRRRDRPALRARGHPAGVARRPEDDGLTDSPDVPHARPRHPVNPPRQGLSGPHRRSSVRRVRERELGHARGTTRGRDA